LIWVTWVQHRREALVVAVVLFGTATAIIIDARWIGVQDSHREIEAISALVTALPALLGMFIAAPLMSGEFERGTILLAWTQSVSRLRWATVKLALCLAGVIVASVALVALVGWWREPIDPLSSGLWPGFDIEGIVPVAYAVFAFALGITAGLVLRRIVPAMALTLVIFTGARVIVESNRTSFQSLVIGSPTGVPRGSWVPGGAYWADAHGRVLNLTQVNAIMSGYHGPANGNGAAIFTYMHQHGVDLLVAYFSADSFWNFQLIEAGLFLVAALVLTVGALWWLKRSAV
jgi:ABC-type transport system involved in multi-copper enzyme maturation permease subunit